MTQVQIGEIVIGLVLLGGGGWKGWQTWQRLHDLQGQEDNLRRYDAWRGGRRNVPGGPSEAEIVATDLRRGIGIWGSLAVIGIILIVLAVLAR